MINASDLPPVLAGPLLRHVGTDCMRLWLVTSEPCRWWFRLQTPDGERQLRVLERCEQTQIPIGRHAWLQLLQIRADFPWPPDRVLHYDLGLMPDTNDGGESGEAIDSNPADARWIADWAPHLCHEKQSSPHVVIRSRITRLLHGSCRKPHHDSSDGLIRVDAEIADCADQAEQRPALLIMSGDQVYVDDVAGPMLRAIHQLDARLGLFDELVDGAIVDTGSQLIHHADTYYRRTRLLPKTQTSTTLIERFFGGARKPVFTTANAQNHLITLSEVMAMYLLVWSPIPWTLIEIDEPALTPALRRRYRQEKQNIDAFIAGLPEASRALCHVPCYMIFDDHDITDDWNLSMQWETTAYEHPFSRRIVGNALIAYTLCQGWGNHHGRVDELIPACQRLLSHSADSSGCLDAGEQDALVDSLLDFRGWQYTLPTDPVVVVLNTRTHRWRRPEKPSRPSGLMDWEGLTSFQQEILDQDAVIVVSPAPVFGVKLIEIVQRVFTFFGKPLMVDAENWMAHHEAATVMLSIFRHSHTPQTFTLLSGDVHYSFAYDVTLRYEAESPAIWQITSSGIKNEFPVALIEWLDRLNRFLFAPRSPLNLLTQRHSFHIYPRLPEGRSAGERLWNHSGIGDVRFDAHGRPSEIGQLNACEGGTRFRKGRIRE